MIKFPYKEKAPFKLDLIPMINVVFLLLIFFMLTSTTTKQTKKVELPKAKTAEKNSKEYLVMTIDKKGSLELDGKVVTLEVLPTHLEEKINQKKNTVISIHADKAIEFELFGKVIELAKQAGAEDFMLATGTEKTEAGS
ncbi:MAG: biopolymer transporter ExbD [Nitrospinae bacterium]|nr:biopolymer transporter ExbD [Nitrospinota bacterium]MZH13434.1 biopolymer transporter ExbD [Nitrospinota bacterium]